MKRMCLAKEESEQDISTCLAHKRMTFACLNWVYLCVKSVWRCLLCLTICLFMDFLDVFNEILKRELVMASAFYMKTLHLQQIWIFININKQWTTQKTLPSYKPFKHAVNFQLKCATVKIGLRPHFVLVFPNFRHLQFESLFFIWCLGTYSGNMHVLNSCSIIIYSGRRPHLRSSWFSLLSQPSWCGACWCYGLYDSNVALALAMHPFR